MHHIREELIREAYGRPGTKKLGLGEMLQNADSPSVRVEQNRRRVRVIHHFRVRIGRSVRHKVVSRDIAICRAGYTKCSVNRIKNPFLIRRI